MAEMGTVRNAEFVSLSFDQNHFDSERLDTNLSCLIPILELGHLYVFATGTKRVIVHEESLFISSRINLPYLI